MIRLLADHNVLLHVELIWSVFTQAEWEALGVAAAIRFSDVGLAVTASDREVWLACQTQSLLLLTANRSDSLTAVIDELNHATALPVLTIASAGRVFDYDYREDCAYAIADVVARLERSRGSARIFIPY